MSRQEVTHFVTREVDGAFAVIAQVKSYGSMGPDPGLIEHESTVVEGVSREYADMLGRELTKKDFDERWPGDCNIFVVHTAIERRIDMWTGPNAANWADNPKHELVY